MERPAYFGTFKWENNLWAASIKELIKSETKTQLVFHLQTTITSAEWEGVKKKKERKKHRSITFWRQIKWEKS